MFVLSDIVLLTLSMPLTVVVLGGIAYLCVKFNYFEGILFDYYIIEYDGRLKALLRFYHPAQVIEHIIYGKVQMPRVGASDGYCYVDMLLKQDAARVAMELGKFPTLGRILRKCEGRTEVTLEEVAKHLHTTEYVNVYHYDRDVENDQPVNLRVDMRIGGFNMSNPNESWFVSNDVFIIAFGLIALFTYYVLFYIVFILCKLHWYNPFVMFMMFVVLPGGLVFSVYYLRVFYTHYKISKIFGNGIDDLADCSNGYYELKQEFVEENDKIVRTITEINQDYETNDQEQVRYTTGEKDYTITGPKEMEGLFRMMKDYFSIIPHGFEFSCVKNSVTTGHDLSTMVNKLVRKVIHNDIPQGKRVLHVGENVIAMDKGTGHVCCNPQTEPNDANRVTKAKDFIRQYNAQNENKIEYTNDNFSDITSRYDVVTAIHSVYNQPFSEFFGNCVAVGAKTVYVVMHFNPLILSHDHLVLPFSKFIVDHDKIRNKIYFRHSTTDEKNYSHDRKEYLKYLFYDTVKVQYLDNVLYYHRKVLMNCCDVIVFRYDMNEVAPFDDQDENLNMCLGDKFLGYYKLEKIDSTLEFLSTSYVPSMMFISTEFETAITSKQFDGVERKGYAIESALFDGRNERSRVHRYFSKVFMNSDRDLDFIAQNKHDYLTAEVYEIEDYKQVTLKSYVMNLVVTANELRENDYVEILDANRDLVEINASLKNSDDLLDLLVTTVNLADQEKWEVAAETFARRPVVLQIREKYISNRMALTKNVKNVIYLSKENDKFYRANYDGEEMNHNIGNLNEQDVYLVDTLAMFVLLANVEFNQMDESFFEQFDEIPENVNLNFLNSHTMRVMLNNNNGMIIKNSRIYLSDGDNEILPEMRIFMIKCGKQYLKCGKIIREQDEVIMQALNNMEIKNSTEFML